MTPDQWIALATAALLCAVFRILDNRRRGRLTEAERKAEDDDLRHQQQIW